MTELEKLRKQVARLQSELSEAERANELLKILLGEFYAAAIDFNGGVGLFEKPCAEYERLRRGGQE